MEDTSWHFLFQGLSEWRQSQHFPLQKHSGFRIQRFDAQCQTHRSLELHHLGVTVVVQVDDLLEEVGRFVDMLLRKGLHGGAGERSPCDEHGCVVDEAVSFERV